MNLINIRTNISQLINAMKNYLKKQFIQRLMKFKIFYLNLKINLKPKIMENPKKKKIQIIIKKLLEILNIMNLMILILRKKMSFGKRKI